MANVKITAALLAVTALTVPGAFAQDSQATPTQQTKPAPAPKKPKVWTDDNIDALRTPADVYQDQEAQQSAAEQAAQVKAAAEAKLPSPPTGFVKPTSVQQAQQLLAQAQGELKSEQQYVQQTQKELATAPDSYKDRLQWRINSRTQIINKLQKDIAALEKDRDDLAKGNASGSASASASTAGQQ